MLARVGGMGRLNENVASYFRTMVSRVVCGMRNRSQRARNRSEVVTCSDSARTTMTWKRFSPRVFILTDGLFVALHVLCWVSEKGMNPMYRRITLGSH